MTGGAHVLWTVPQQGGYTAYRNSVSYISNQLILWARQGTQENDLPIGEHILSFQYQLPHNIPPSFEGSCGQIRYEIEAQAVPSGLGRFSNCTVRAPLIVRERSDLLRLCREPRTGEIIKRVKFLCFRFGCVTATITVPLTGFSPGDAIPIHVDISNQTTRSIRICADLQRVDTFFAAGCRNVQRINVAHIAGPQIAPGEDTSLDTRTLIVDVNAPTTIRSCSCISVEYILVATVKIPWSFDKKLYIPVVIAYAHPGAAVDCSAPLDVATSCIQQNALACSEEDGSLSTSQQHLLQ